MSFGQQKKMLDGVLKHPEHICNLLFFCAQTSVKGISKQGFPFGRWQLSQIASENNINTSERQLLLPSPSSGEWMTAADSA